MELIPFKKHKTLDTGNYNMLVSRDVINDEENEDTTYNIKVSVSFEVVDEINECSMYMDQVSNLSYMDIEQRDLHFELILSDNLDALRDLDQLALHMIEQGKELIKNM